MADGANVEIEIPCAFGRYCIRHGFVHGFEAEDLRRGLERLIAVGSIAKGDAVVALARFAKALFSQEAIAIRYLGQLEII